MRATIAPPQAFSAFRSVRYDRACHHSCHGFEVISGMQRVCFELRVKAERIPEYIDRHRAIWPEMAAALKAAGWNNYSLFLRPDGLLIGYFETSSLRESEAKIAATDVNARWQSEMRDFFVDEPDRLTTAGLSTLTEVLHLEDQLLPESDVAASTLPEDQLLPVVIVAKFSAKPGLAPQVIDAFQEVSPLVHQEPGCELYAAHLERGGDVVIMVERWTTQADIDHHAQGKPLARLNELTLDLLLKPYEVWFLDAVPLGAHRGRIPPAR